MVEESTAVEPATWVAVVSGNAFAFVVVGASVVLDEVEELVAFVVLAATVVLVTVVLVVDLAVDEVDPDSPVVGGTDVEVEVEVEAVVEVAVLLVAGSEVDVEVELGGVLVLVVVQRHVVDEAVVVGCELGPQNWTLEMSGVLFSWPTFGRPALEKWPSYCGGAIEVTTDAVPPFTITAETPSVECHVAPDADAPVRVTTC